MTTIIKIDDETLEETTDLIVKISKKDLEMQKADIEAKLALFSKK